MTAQVKTTTVTGDSGHRLAFVAPAYGQMAGTDDDARSVLAVLVAALPVRTIAALDRMIRQAGGIVGAHYAAQNTTSPAP